MRPAWRCSCGTQPAQALDRLSQVWDERIVPQLTDYIRIPAKSPMFEPGWEGAGLLDTVVRNAADWVLAQQVAGLTAEVVRLPGRTPVLFFEIAATRPASPQTVLMYGHLDKQPEFSGWRADLGPWTPKMEDGKLYGRGGADDGYAALMGALSGNDGGTETYAFTEIDRQTAVGGQFTGHRWGRGADRWGVALAVNEISGPHRDYLKAGGQGFFLGDGALNYAPERVFETWYRWALPDWATRTGKVQSAVSLGWQHISNPGYNQDRGPVQVYSLRWHSEF